MSFEDADFAEARALVEEGHGTIEDCPTKEQKLGRYTIVALSLNRTIGVSSFRCGQVEPRDQLSLIHPLRPRLGHLCRTGLGVEGNRQRRRLFAAVDSRRLNWDFRPSSVAAVLPVGPSRTTKW